MTNRVGRGRNTDALIAFSRAIDEAHELARVLREDNTALFSIGRKLNGDPDELQRSLDNLEAAVHQLKTAI